MIFFEARCRCNERINAAYNSTGKRAFKSLFCCVLLTKDTKQVKEAELEEVWKVKQYESPEKMGGNFDHIGLTPDALPHA